MAPARLAFHRGGADKPGSMTKTEPSSVASQRVADILAERITSGQLRPGERIKQDELAQELGISRIPVRDALRILETRGLVTLKANAGARVTALTLEDMKLSYRIRAMLEPMLLAGSIPNLTDAAIAEMAGIKARLEAYTDLDEYLMLAREFHWTAFAGADMPLLAQIVERLWDTTQSYRRAYAKLARQDSERAATLHAERDLLFRAIKRREVEVATAMLALHIEHTALSLESYGHLNELMG